MYDINLCGGVIHVFYGFLSLINCTFDDSGAHGCTVSGLTPGKNDIAMWTGGSYNIINTKAKIQGYLSRAYGTTDCNTIKQVCSAELGTSEYYVTYHIQADLPTARMCAQEVRPSQRHRCCY